MIQLKRVYDAPEKTDGFRILVDRLWPRGIAKAEAHIDLWLKEIAPSDELRKWFAHDPQKWEAFQTRYQQELTEKKELLDQVSKLEKQHKVITLLYGAKDTEHNQAVVLAAVLH